MGIYKNCGKALPDAKQALNSLFSSLDEEELALTNDEYRQAVAEYRRRFPDDLDGMYREAQLAISEESYDVAETLLRQGLKVAESNESAEGAENYKSQFGSGLTTTLFKLGKVNEAFNSLGDRKEDRAKLFRLAVADERWDDLRSLIKLQQAEDPNDVQLRVAAADLAAHENQWDEAVRLLQEARNAAPEEDKWQTEYRLRNVYLDAGRWREYYNSEEDRKKAFDAIGSSLAVSQKWTELNQLIAEHFRQFPDDIRIVEYRARAASATEDYISCARDTQRLLQDNSPGGVATYERKALQDRLLSALLRSKQNVMALQFAESCLREQNDPEYLAVVAAANGDTSRAKHWAEKAAKKNKSAATLYSNAVMGPTFVAPEFTDLHREYPVELQFDSATMLAVFLLDRAMQLDASNIAAALKESGIELAIDVQAIESLRKSSTGAFALPVGPAHVWLITGTGGYFEQPRVTGGAAATRQAFEKRQAWLMVGVAGWTEFDRSRAERLAQRLAVQLANGHSEVVWRVGMNLGIALDSTRQRRNCYPHGSLCETWTNSSRRASR